MRDLLGRGLFHLSSALVHSPLLERLLRILYPLACEGPPAPTQTADEHVEVLFRYPMMKVGRRVLAVGAERVSPYST